MFFYNSSRYIETGDIAFALAGNGPIFVDRNGAVKTLPTSVPWEIAIKKSQPG
ncbi:YrhB domain-containing protein [Bradyrhizobium uaiense]|uniref:YrhB domain-containing protein n=1 Tax=Bradyrhizobium uaiense TaxID=2594946 RepID=UPI003D31D26A